MRSAYQRSGPDRGSLRRRSVALILTLVAHILLLIGFLTLTPAAIPVIKQTALATFDLLPERAASPKPKTRTAARKARSAPARRAPPPPVVPPILKKPDFPAIKLTSDEFAAADISKLPSHKGEGAGSAQGSGDSAAAYGPGEGPGGARLYNAEWYREPRDGELALYLPPGGPRTGWGMIACQTIEKYHVDNCQQIGESPGSGLARAIRQAAWQFLVRPPRIDGKPIVGAWVRIRIEFTPSGTEVGGGSGR